MDSVRNQANVIKAFGESFDGDPAENEGWLDLFGGLMGVRLDAANVRVGFDLFNAGLKFDDNARYPEEPAITGLQYNHNFELGADAVLRPHFHWLQQYNVTPNMLLAYKLSSNNVIVPFADDYTAASGYTLVAPTGSVWAMPSLAAGEAFVQITKFPEIDLSALSISGMIDFVFFRDSLNASGLFSGADTYTGAVTVKFLDGHARVDQGRGSRQEYVK